MGLGRWVGHGLPINQELLSSNTAIVAFIAVIVNFHWSKQAQKLAIQDKNGF